MKKQQVIGHIPMKKGTYIDVSLPVILFEEDNIHYAYCAALDILGYGYTEEEARKSFEVMLHEIIHDAASEGNLEALLSSYGWQKNVPPKTSDLLARNHNLADIMDNKEFRTIRQTVLIPCA